MDFDLPHVGLLIAAGAAAFVGARRWPRATAVCLVFVLFTSLSDVLASDDGRVSVNLVAVGGCVSGILASRGRRVVMDRVLGCMVLYALAMLLSAVAAVDADATRRAAAVYAREIAIAFVLLNLVRSMRGLRLAIRAIVAAGAVLAGGAMVGFTTGLDLAGFARVYHGTIANNEVGGRLSGVVGDPNIFGQILVLVLPFALYMAWNEQRSIVRGLGLATVGLLVLAVALTFSRGALLGLTFVLVACTARQRVQRLRHGIQLALVLLVIGFFVPHVYWDRLGNTMQFFGGDWARSTSDASLSERWRLWRVGGLMLLDQPLTGIGMDNYGLRYQDFFRQIDPTLPCCPMGAHMLLIRIAAETGLIGAALFMATVVLAIAGVRGARRQLSSSGLDERWVFDAIELGLLGYVTTSLFLDGQYMRTFWIVVGLALVARQLMLAPTGNLRSPIPRHWTASPRRHAVSTAAPPLV